MFDDENVHSLTNWHDLSMGFELFEAHFHHSYADTTPQQLATP